MRKWRKFIKAQGCVYKRMKGGHEVWNKPDLKRPIVFNGTTREIKREIIKSNIKTLGVSTEDYLRAIERSDLEADA